MSEAENQFVPTVKPGRAPPSSPKLQPGTQNDSNLLMNGLSIPIYLIVLICVGFGLLLWIAAWIGWSCRKCCQAQKDKDERYIRNEINEMIRNANQEIQLDPEDVEDIEVVPLKAK